MDDALTPERFRALAEAYGGVIARWPEADRLAAMRVASEPFASAVLADALALDEALDEWRVSAPSLALTDRIGASRVATASIRARRVRLWWAGLGLAAALSGATAGAATVALVAPVESPSGANTSFGDVSGQES